MTAERTHYVYRVFDDRGLLLYVGCTGNFEKRMTQHRADHRTNLWIGYARHAKLEGPFEKAVAFKREGVVIETDRPYFNVLSEHRKIGLKRRTMSNRLHADLRHARPDLFIPHPDGLLPDLYIQASDEIRAKVDRAIPPVDAEFRHRLYLNARIAHKALAS